MAKLLLFIYVYKSISYSGIKTVRYTRDLGIDVENNPLHRCYCNPDKEKCLKKGAFDVYKCVKVPLIVTNPHFYLADPYYLSTVGGLEPIKEKHMIIVDPDLFSGAPLYVHTRAQVNIFITNVKKVKLMANFPDALLPLLWFDEHIVLPEFILKDIKFGHMMYTIGKIFQNLMLLSSLITGGYAMKQISLIE